MWRITAVPYNKFSNRCVSMSTGWHETIRTSYSGYNARQQQGNNTKTVLHQRLIKSTVSFYRDFVYFLLLKYIFIFKCHIRVHIVVACRWCRTFSSILCMFVSNFCKICRVCVHQLNQPNVNRNNFLTHIIINKLCISIQTHIHMYVCVCKNI